MTSVPKPLKFLRPHFDKIKAVYESYTDPENKAQTSLELSLFLN